MKKEMKKWLCGVGTLTICVMLTGCGHEHTWADATCTEPKTCSECGETEGEAIGHTWVEATCAEPKHCSVCGETEGEPLEHTLTEANYQQAATCTVCGETVGDALTPYFVEYDIKGQFMEVGKSYDYVTGCYTNLDYKTIGQATITDYQTFASDDTHEAKEGYEWKTLEMQIVFSDENAWNYAASVSWVYGDYYSNEDEDNDNEADDNEAHSFTVNFNGLDYTECSFEETYGFGKWQADKTITWTQTYEYLLPVGYDGVILGWYDTSVGEWEDGMHMHDVFNDDSLLFRLD